MILHPDGRVEGTPEEVAAYKRNQNPAITFVPSAQVDFRRISNAQGGRIMTEADWTIEQIRERYPIDSDFNDSMQVAPLAHVPTAELISALSGRTGVKHVPILQDDEIKLQVANEKRLSVRQREAEEFVDWKYILIERD